MSFENIPDRTTRLDTILRHLESLPSAENAFAAYTQIKGVFNENENSAQLRIDKVNQMDVSPFGEMTKIKYEGLKILLELYKKHLLLLGQNGAIDIKMMEKDVVVTSGRIQQDPLIAKDKMKTIFSKAGADGKNVWGEAT